MRQPETNHQAEPPSLPVVDSHVLAHRPQCTLLYFRRDGSDGLTADAPRRDPPLGQEGGGALDIINITTITTRVSYLPLSHMSIRCVSRFRMSSARAVSMPQTPETVRNSTCVASDFPNEGYPQTAAPLFHWGQNRGSTAAERFSSNVLAKKDRRPLLHLGASRHSGVGGLHT